MKKHLYTPLIARTLICLLLLLSCAGLPLLGSSRALSHPGDSRGVGKTSEQNASSPFKALPLRFERNDGQTDSQVRFLASSQSGEVFLTPSEMVLRVCQTSPKPVTKAGLGSPAAAPSQAELKSAVVRLHAVHANPQARITGIDQLPGKTNYFLGNDPKKWHTNVPSFAKVKYENIYPGIDLIYYGNEGNLEYDFNVAPGADPSQIALTVEGADGVNIDEGGNLVLRTAVGEVRQHAPHIYQQDGKTRQEIAGGYVLRQDGRVAFDLGGYDVSKALVIDPELVYATYFGGSAGTDVDGIGVDSAGSVYVTGDTFAHDFPTRNPLQSGNRHSQNLSAFVSKFSPDGQSLVYSTYLGGSTNFAGDMGTGIALDSTGAAYITGLTNSTDFPTRNAIQSQYGGAGDIFVAKISADGASLVYSTYLGGSSLDVPRGIKLDASNKAYVYGQTSSSNFPTVNADQANYGGNTDGFWALISADGAQLLLSTYVGDNGQDSIQSLIVYRQTGDVYLTRHTQPSSLAANAQSQSVDVNDSGPIYNYRYDLTLHEGKFEALAIHDQLHSSDMGETFSELDPNTIPLFLRKEQQANELEAFVWGGCVTAAADSTCSGNSSFVTLDATTLAVKNSINITDIIPSVHGAVRDSQDAVYITGTAPTSAAFPLVNPIQSGGGGSDAYVTVFAPVTRQIVFSTYLGGSAGDFSSGIALDTQGNIYIVGTTLSPNFPTKNAYQGSPPAPSGQFNGFIVKISSLGTIQAGPDFSLGFDQSTVTASAPSKVKLSVNITRSGGFAGNVTITPGEITAKGIVLSTDPVATTGGSVKFKVKLKGSAQPGSYPITFTGKDDAGKTHIATLTLVIQ